VRRQDWPERLADYLHSRIATPFSYGNGGHDCCQFAALAVEAMTSENPAANWHYSCELGAARLIHKAGGLETLITEAMGSPVHPSKAGRGDIVLAELEKGPTIGVCVGRDCVFPADVGLTHRERGCIQMAWKV
jgi:hypothetical protein